MLVSLLNQMHITKKETEYPVPSLYQKRFAQSDRFCYKESRHADAKDHLLRKNDAAVDFTYIYGLVEDL